MMVMSIVIVTVAIAILVFLTLRVKTNLSVCLEPDFPHFEESYIEQLPRPHYPKERVWQTSEKKQIIRNIFIIWSSFIYKKLLISCLATF